MINVRKMETLGGAMGLIETLNSNLTSSSDSNNIDVHMEKNTEYGALAILSASNYGNPNKVASGETTTGNATGVVMNLNKEWVAASASECTAANFKLSSLRYKNLGIGKLGDSTTETSGWHGSDKSQGISNASAALVRSISGSIFSYTGIYQGTGDRTGAYTNQYRTRAVVVSGQGL